MKSFHLPRLARLLTVVCAAALAAGGFTAGPAQAAEPEQHCLVVMPDPGFVRCFDTLDEVDQFAKNAGAVVGPAKGASGTGPAAGTASLTGGAGLAAVSLTLISREYDLPFFLGSSRSVYGTNGPCTTTVNDVDYQLPDWSAFGFNQKISSFQTFSNCWAKHYDLVSYGGLAVGYQGTQAVINAALDNDTSSERWS